MKWKIPLGAVIGGLLALFYVSMIAGRYEFIDEMFTPLWLLTADICQSLGKFFYGSSEGGMLFIIPSWVTYGAIAGVVVSGCICLATHFRSKKDNAEPET